MRLRSQVLNWQALVNLVFPLNFLDPARSMRSPVIKSILLRQVLTYNTGTSGGPARMLPMSLTRIRITDQTKERVNLRGSSGRVMNQLEYGSAYQDGTNTAASQTAVTQESCLNIPFNPWKSRRRNDYGIPLFEFVDGGGIEINTAAAVLATNFHTITSGTYQLFVDIDETRAREAKSRLCYRDMDITQTEFSVPVGGALRWFAYYAGEGTETTQTALASQNFTSQTLEFSIFPREILRNGYRIEQLSGARIADVAAATTTEDVFITMQAVLLAMVDEDGKIPEMPQIASLHVQTDGSVPSTTPKYIFSYIADRDPSSTARTLNAKSPADLNNNLQAYGTIKTASGKLSPLKNWPEDTARAMPLKLRKPAAQVAASSSSATS
jgi:hypothetical protein